MHLVFGVVRKGAGLVWVWEADGGGAAGEARVVQVREARLNFWVEPLPSGRARRRGFHRPLQQGKTRPLGMR